MKISLLKVSASLMTKGTIIGLTTGLIVFGIIAFLTDQQLTNINKRHCDEKTGIIQNNLIHDIRERMSSKGPAGLPALLDTYRAYKGVEELRIFNIKGDEVFVKEKGSYETMVQELLRTGKSIHLYKEINKIPVSFYITPLENKPECQACHGKGEKLLGALLLSLSMEDMVKEIHSQRWRFNSLFALTAIGIIFIAVISVNRLFLKPLKQLRKGADAIKKGQLDYQIPVESKDEIGELSRVFNSMAQTLKQNEDELRQSCRLLSHSQKEWENTFESIADLISIHDRDFNILRANRAFAEYFGLPPQEVINKKCYELFHGTDSPLLNCPHKMTLNENQQKTVEILDPKTNKIFCISTFPYYSPERELIGSVHIAKDITEEKEKEMRLIMSERLASLGQMASGIAHEINNPLASISGCVEVLLSRAKKGNFEHELFENYLEIIWEEILRCKGITTSVLSFVRRATYEKKEIKINEVLDKTLEIIGIQGRLQEVNVIKSYKEDMPVILGSEGELRQGFIIIITNALDAMEDKGTLTIETGIIPPPLIPPLLRGELRGVEEEQGGFVFIKITDTGPGIPPEHINRIFDPFFTTKPEKKGTGLGLSIARTIIINHNGSIDVTSEEGEGATFKITLPI